tara:strand:- start:7486 stop:8094 length:609 start_codon:yes stop_codon:yes gene_type:complete
MKYPAEVLTRREVGALLDACGKEKWTDRRNYALITLLYRSGLRLAEALALRLCDIELERGAIRVLHGKGGRARTVGIDSAAAMEIGNWIDEHQAIGYSNGDPLFLSASGRAMTQGYLRRKLPELGKQAGIFKRVHAHGLRHTHAAELRAEGVDIAVIKRQLGHTSLLTTIRYLDHLEPESVVETIRGRLFGAELEGMADCMT